ncbi:hypothetical protein Nepgr_031818 [Nepenthes gracilis]|uniref:Uncharacterized protein n=1 Tax=Nepenthes gracilis TaxID=150966 RepID=A0AAD3THF5_NEPGR|nr:hypothetical protein Nepgr_031818 [Nepenthes gracilis]
MLHADVGGLALGAGGSMSWFCYALRQFSKECEIRLTFSWIRIGLYAGLGVERSSASLWAHAIFAIGSDNQCCSSNVDVLYLELLI